MRLQAAFFVTRGLISAEPNFFLILDLVGVFEKLRYVHKSYSL